MIGYGFIYHDHEGIEFIFQSRTQVIMCFGSEAIALEKGRIVKLKIEVIE